MSQTKFAAEANIHLQTGTPEIKQEASSFWESDLGEALLDCKEGIYQWRLWWFNAVNDIRRRYRRTIIGPFWTTLSLSIFIASMSILFSYLWKMDIPSFLPFFASGFICWVFVSTIITDSCTVFISAEGLAKQIPLPFSFYSCVLIARNLLVLAHHSVVYILIVIFLKVPVNANLLLLIPGMILLCITGFWVSITIGLICARYRDFQQVVTSLLQISMFVTPIFWPPTQLQGRQFALFVNGNPLYHYVSIVRNPLLGKSPEMLSWIVVIGCTALGLCLTLWLFSKKRKRLIFWL